MDTVTILFNDREIELDEIDDSMSWEDLFDLLYDSEVIDDEEYQLGMISDKFHLFVEENLDLRTQEKAENNSSSDVGRTSGISFGGVKKSGLQSPPNSSSGERFPQPIGRDGTGRLSFGKTKPIQKKGKSVSFGDKKPIHEEKPIQPKPVPQPELNIRKTGFIYNLDVKCSNNAKKWVSIIQSDVPPTTFELKPKQTTVQGPIHLVLDDSGSMGWENPTRLSQLILAVNHFLDGRPSKETIHLHTFNDTLSGKGSPSKIRRIINGKWDLQGTPMKACLTRVAMSLNTGDILLLFTDGDGQDGSPISIAKQIKNNGVRFISVGCGEAKARWLKPMASTNADYHHATKAKDLVQIFQNISKSLSQSRPVSVTKGKKNSSSVAKQIAKNDWKSASVQSGSNKLGANQGYAFIEDFQCYHCNDSSRIVCGGCGESLCGGGIKNNELKCPICSVVSQVEFSTEAYGKVSASGKSKGK
jgi:phage FluMu protein Com